MPDSVDKEGCLWTALAMVVVLLFFYVMIDVYAGWRDMHHIHDLQRRIGELEQCK